MQNAIHLIVWSVLFGYPLAFPDASATERRFFEEARNENLGNTGKIPGSPFSIAT
jgi:hypothetical protein